MEPTADHSATRAKRPSPPQPPLQPPVRLSLASHEALPGGFDGAWWPYSHDLADELPVLVQAMDGVGSITRVILGIERWPDIPHRVAVGGQFVSAGWFASGHEQDVIVLCSYREGFRTLLVVPPTTAADTAAWLMNTPVSADGSRTASELLGIATARCEAIPVDDPL